MSVAQSTSVQARFGWKREQHTLQNELRTHERLARQQKRLPHANAANSAASTARAKPASAENQVRGSGPAAVPGVQVPASACERRLVPERQGGGRTCLTGGCVCAGSC